MQVYAYDILNGVRFSSFFICLTTESNGSYLLGLHACSTHERAVATRVRLTRHIRACI